MISFDQEALQAGQNVTVTTDTPGTFQFATNLPGDGADGNWNATAGDSLILGPARIGGFAANISDPDEELYFYSWFTILPDGDQLTLDHYAMQPSAAFQQQPAFSNDILSKYLDVLLSPKGGIYLQEGLHTAAAAFPGDAAAALGDTIVLATIFFPEVTVPFLIGVAADTVLEFFGRVNDAIIDEMISGGDLTQQEGDFLTLVFGLPAFLNGVQGVIGDEAAIDRAKDALGVADVVHDLSSTAGEMDYGVRFNAMASDVPSTAVVIHINSLP